MIDIISVLGYLIGSKAKNDLPDVDNRVEIHAGVDDDNNITFESLVKYYNITFKQKEFNI